jgi:DNA-binding response OmpR family regulator
MGGSRQSAVGSRDGCCPHCGQVVHKAPADLVAALEGLGLYGQERRFADSLLSRWPRLVTNETLAADLWDWRNVDITAPEISIKVYASKLRRKFERFGWTIRTRRGNGLQFERLPTADCRLPERGS